MNNFSSGGTARKNSWNAISSVASSKRVTHVKPLFSVRSFGYSQTTISSDMGFWVLDFCFAICDWSDQRFGRSGHFVIQAPTTTQPSAKPTLDSGFGTGQLAGNPVVFLQHPRVDGRRVDAPTSGQQRQ